VVISRVGLGTEKNFAVEDQHNLAVRQSDIKDFWLTKCTVQKWMEAVTLLVEALFCKTEGSVFD
jgi:hypothetical protein